MNHREYNASCGVRPEGVLKIKCCTYKTRTISFVLRAVQQKHTYVGGDFLHTYITTTTAKIIPTVATALIATIIASNNGITTVNVAVAIA